MMRQATRTEYKGIVFDSKSEAVFARAMDIAGLEWVYHPNKIHGRHPWDFLLFPTSRRILVELKPAKPTKTYVENLSRCSQWDNVEAILIYGSPWVGIPHGYRCSYVVIPVAGKTLNYRIAKPDIVELLGITEKIAQEARNYRFDLEAAIKESEDETASVATESEPDFILAFASELVLSGANFSLVLDWFGLHKSSDKASRAKFVVKLDEHIDRAYSRRGVEYYNNGSICLPDDLLNQAVIITLIRVGKGEIESTIFHRYEGVDIRMQSKEFQKEFLKHIGFEIEESQQCPFV